ncbi:MAG: nitroreductase family protein [Myxococcales bacterium]|nr:nitroreductase family protein [Myxococcales bacterium]
MTLADLHALLASRASVRGFAPTPLPRARLEAVFAAAQRAASWCNIQPWRVVVTDPPATERVRAALVAAARGAMPGPDLPFPLDYPEPYSAHRRACGGALYGAMGIARDDKASRYDAWLRNFALFDAPHVAIVSVDRRLGPYALIDVGVWLGTLLAALAADEIAACPMASAVAYPKALRAELAIPDEHQLLFGVALGTASAAPANACRTTRAPIDANVTFVE